MEKNYLSLGRRAVRHWLRLLLLFALLLIGVFSPFAWLVQAEGSVNLIANGGDRPHLEDRNGTLGGFSRSNVIKVFVREGETINLGSSALGIGAGAINYTPPVGPGGSCAVISPTGYIPNLAAELAGPRHPMTNPGPDTFIPCVVPVGPGQGGIWEIEFESPNPNGFPVNPPRRAVTDAWPMQNNTNSFIIAWDVTVRDGAGNSLPGRVFANYLTLNMGLVTGTLRSRTFVQTVDGYRYLVDMNGLNPFVFTYFANNKGYTTLADTAIYRSLQFTYPLVVNDQFGGLPPGFTIHNPSSPDEFAANNITHKIFFNEPDITMPQTATVPGGGQTWLYRLPVPPPTPTLFSFVGVEGTPGQAGTAPLSGTFFFNSSITGSFSLVIDINKNTVFTDPEDRTLFGTTHIGTNQVFWDGLDNDGNPVPPGPVPYGSQLTFSGGETHFPFLDPERNPNGYIIQRLVDPNSASPEPDPFLVYYNDRYNYNGNNTYDFSLCAAGESPPPPFNLGCYGTPPTPRNGSHGVLSNGGAHQWSPTETVINQTFGNLRGIDTWVLYPSESVLLTGGILLAEADLQIRKTHTPEPVAPGGLITYTILVTNAGPSPAPGITVSDTFPGLLSGINWTCSVISGTGNCPASGTGDISATLDLSQTAVARFQVVATIASTTTDPFTNTVQVDRPNDVTDPNLANNIATDVATLSPEADLAIGKDSQPKPLVANQAITYTIVVTNFGPSPVSNITVTDNLPPQVLNPTYSAIPNTYDPATGAWTGVNLDAGETVTLTIVGTVSPSTQLLVNTAIVSSTVTDPFTPNNRITHTNIMTPEADLAIIKNSQPKPLVPGQGITYTLVVTNFGPSTVNNITVTDNLPPGVLAPSYSPSTGNYNPFTGAWTGLTLNSGDQIILTIVGTVDPAVSSLSNMAVVTSPVTDPFTPNNSFTDTNVFASPILNLLKTVSPAGQVVPGQTLTYTLCYSNSGGITATNTVLTDVIPANTTYVNGSANPSTDPDVQFNDGSTWVSTEPATGTVGIRWLIEDLAPNSVTSCVSFQVRINTNLNLAGQQLKYTPEGWLIPPPATPEAAQEPVSPPVSVTPVLTVTPLVTPAPTLTTTPVITFTPTATIEARMPLLSRGPGLALLPWWQETVTPTVEETDEPTETPEPAPEATETTPEATEPTEETTPEAPEVTETTPEAAEVTETVTATEEAPPATEAPATETPVVTETATTEPVTETPPATETVSAPVITMTPALTDTPDPATPAVTETVAPPPVLTETVTATPVPSATETVISPTITASPTLTPVATVTASPTITVTVTPTLTPTLLPPTPQSWRLVPLATYSLTIRNNATLGSDNAPPVTSSVTKPLIALVDPGITKVANVEEAEPGDEVIFTIEVFNEGNLRATNVRVVDPVPGFLDILEVTTDDPTIPPADIVGQVFTVNVGVLDPQERVVITLRTRVNDSAANEPNPIRNTATLTFDEGNPLQDADQVTVPPSSPPSGGGDGDDDDDDDDDGGGGGASSPPPTATPGAPPAVALAPTVPAPPTLPVLYLPETGLREGLVETGNRGGLLFLILGGAGLMLLFYRYRSQKRGRPKP